MSWLKQVAIFLAVLLAPTWCEAEDRLFELVHFEDASSTTGSVVHADERRLQSRVTQPSCFTRNQRYTCGFDAVYQSNTQSATVAININCPVSDDGKYEFRKNAGECTCTALVLDASGRTKPCPCMVCNAGYGPSPVSVNCNYDSRPSFFTPDVVGGCTSFDCGFKCNGTCVGGRRPRCESATDECKAQVCGASTASPNSNGSGTSTGNGTTGSTGNGTATNGNSTNTGGNGTTGGGSNGGGGLVGIPPKKIPPSEVSENGLPVKMDKMFDLGLVRGGLNRKLRVRGN